jgi:choline dehydrogenase
LVFERTRCTGVVFRRADEHPTTVHAHREVILAAGAIGSPQLLQVSGVGPADLLAEHRIDVVADMPGVGENLSDHPLGVIVYSATRQLHSSSNNHFDALAAVRIDSESGGPDAHLLVADLPLPPPGYTAPQNGFTIEFSMLRPLSRGSVKIASADPAAAPLIDPGFLTDERDVRFTLRALRATRQLGRSSEFEQWGAAERIPGADVTSDRELTSYLRRSVGTYYHAVGTCRMGAGVDAVTDTELRVKAVDGLRVVDASVMPSLPAANTNAIVLAIAEKAAELIASGW